MPAIKVVLGLQFGDEGKGLAVDHLCEQAEKESLHQTIVVRFSGGQQAGHTVVRDGVRHVFSNFASGALLGVPSFFSEHCTIYPNNIYNEREVLKSKNTNPILAIHPFAKVTTPYDVFIGKEREKMNNHGSVGLGVGATMHRSISTPHKLYAVDLMYPKLLKKKLDIIGDMYGLLGSKDPGLRMDLEIFERVVKMNALSGEIFGIEDYEWLDECDNVILEGSQGIMLDMDHGSFPNVTYANTTSKNALEVMNNLGVDHEEYYYVTRCYQTRHGNGWMSNENHVPLVNVKDETNVENIWQGKFRIGELDYEVLNYAMKVDRAYRGGRGETGMLVTCLDQRPDFKFDFNRINEGLSWSGLSFGPSACDIKIEPNSRIPY